MAEEQPRTSRMMDTQTVLALVGIVVLSALALVKGGELWPVALAATLFAMVMIMLRRRAGSDTEKEVLVSVSSVAPDRLQPYAKKLCDALAILGQAWIDRAEAGSIVVSVLTARPLLEIIDCVNRLGLKMELIGVRCQVQYSSIAASAEMLVEIRGTAPPDSTLTIAGLPDEVNVDKTGAFAVRVPVSFLRKHSSAGFIPAVCRRGRLEEQIRIPVPR